MTDNSARSLIRKTSYLVTITHTDKVNMREIESALEQMAESFHHHDPILNVDITSVELAQEGGVA